MHTSKDIKNIRQGVVIKKSTGRYYVDANGKIVVCTISAKLRKRLIYPIASPSSLSHRVIAVKDIQSVDPVAVGDVVRFIDAGNGSGMINSVFPRRSKLIRKAAGDKPLEQVIVANVDQIIPVFSIRKPKPKWNLLDRYLAAAESLNLPSIICLTKTDLGSSDHIDEEIAGYEKIGYRSLWTSSLSGEGLEKFKQVLKDRVSVLIGKSGVGKSSLLNAVQPGLGLRINEVSKKTTKGKHTTSHLEMYPMDFGGRVVDTPGMREFGLWNTDENELAHLFPEMRPYIGTCKFGSDCSHDHEPSCAIKAAIGAGVISPRRYQSYLRMKERE